MFLNYTCHTPVVVVVVVVVLAKVYFILIISQALFKVSQHKTHLILLTNLAKI